MKIKLGDHPGVLINLPSRKRGGGLILCGKVSAHLQGLKCSQSVEIDESSIQRFSTDLKTMDATLKGSTSLTSRTETFELVLKMTAVGHVEVHLSIVTTQFSRPTNTGWTASGYFSFEPGKLQQIVKAIDQ